MILINFSHPLSEHQREQAESVCSRKIEREIRVAVQCDHGAGFAEQVVELVDAANLTADEWQTNPILVIPPSLSAVACACVAELHGRMGYFPPLLRLRPREGATPPVFDVGEIINLQGVRDAARHRR